MTALYNEIDEYAADWLENLIYAKLIAPGVVDRRSIVELQPSDLRGFTQVHLFAGIGGWSLAARLAGWPDDRSAWTASLPCQPYSIANVAHGGGQGQADERNYLPDFDRLISECKPPVIFGEQVQNAIKWGWLDELFTILEREKYACGAAVLPALAKGAAHERKRIFWVADAGGARWSRHQPIECVSFTTKTSLPVHGDSIAGARRALAGDYGGLLSGDGVSIAVERHRAKGYGNAIVPQVAAEIIGAYLDCAPSYVPSPPLAPPV